MNTGVQNSSPVDGMGVALKLHVALGISSGDVAAFVGAGGKSGAILAVSGGLTQEGMKVLVAPTTKMFKSEADMIGPLVTSEDAGDLRAKTEKALSETPAVVVGSGMLSKNRVGGARSKGPQITSRHSLMRPPWSSPSATSTPLALPWTKNTSTAPPSSPTSPASVRARA